MCVLPELVKAEFGPSPVSKKPGCSSHLQLRGSAGCVRTILLLFVGVGPAARPFRLGTTGHDSGLPLAQQPGATIWNTTFALRAHLLRASTLVHVHDHDPHHSHRSCMDRIAPPPSLFSPSPFASHTARVSHCPSDISSLDRCAHRLQIALRTGCSRLANA